MQQAKRDSALFTVFTGIFVTVLVLIPVLSSKVFAIGPFNLPGGTIVFPITFIFNDILTEVYGYARSRRIIWTGLACQVLTAISILIVDALPPAPFWHNQEQYHAILGFAPRIAAASILAYFLGEFTNSFVLSRMKYLQAGRTGVHQSWRFVASTVAGEAVDSIVFMIVAFVGVFPIAELLPGTVTLYVAKVVYEVVALPVSTRVAGFVKRLEGLDVIDNPAMTNYNPFHITENEKT